MPATRPDFIIVGGGRGAAAAASDRKIREVPAGVMNGVNTTFTLSFAPNPQFAFFLFLNGLEQDPYAGDFTLDGRTITYAVPPASSHNHYAFYWVGPGIGAGARTFAGSGDKINYGTNATLFNLQDMSAGVWIKLPSNAKGSIIGYVYGGAAMADNSAFGLAVDGSSNAWSILYAHDHGNAGSHDQDHTFVTAIPNNQWRYVGFTRDTTAKTVKFYVGNGNSIILLESYTYTTNHDGGTSTLTEMQVGNTPGAYGGNFKDFIGTIEEHYVWNRQLTLDEHADAMRGNPSLTGMVLGSVMGDDPEVDISGNGSIGEVTGTTLVSGHN